ncbi:MAG: ion channel [Caulobacteraceae bacterium]
MIKEAPPQPPPVRARRPKSRRPIVQSSEQRFIIDLYHRAMALPLWGVLVLMAGFFMALNLGFAWLYSLDPGGIINLRRGDFLDAFFFSVETFGTIGYGYMAPVSVYANSVMTLETFLGLVYVAIATGLVFARVSRPTARVTFSQHAVVTVFDGVPTLMFRAANRRSNQILEAEVMVTLARDITTSEGHRLRRFEELAVLRARSPLFALTWTVMHRIDPSSPLYGASPESLARDEVELIVVLSGVDDHFAQRIHARHAYGAHEIVWGKRFADVLSVTPDGRRVIDFRRFHDVVDA